MEAFCDFWRLDFDRERCCSQNCHVILSPVTRKINAVKDVQFPFKTYSCSYTVIPNSCFRFSDLDFWNNYNQSGIKFMICISFTENPSGLPSCNGHHSDTG